MAVHCSLYLSSKRPLSALLTAVLLCLFSISGSARAELPRYSMHLGLRGGGHLVFDDFRLTKGTMRGELANGGLVGLTIGGYPVHWFGLEATTDLILSHSDMGGRNSTLLAGLDILLTLSTTSFAPHISAGGGAYVNVDGSHGVAHAAFGRWGLGLRGKITDWLVFRVDVRHLITRGYSENAHNMTATSGFDFLVINDTSPDTDGDGVRDTFDACPNIPGEEALSGCKDSDGDAVPNHRDQCVDVPGPKEHGLCVFGRAATLSEVRNRCAKIRKLGCPDTDGDGVADIEDTCPKIRGLDYLQGCPDADGDSVPDTTDQCRLRAGSIDRAGCPDTDDDEVIDDADKCPKVPGPKDNHGCPEPAALPDDSGDKDSDSED